MFSFSMVPGNTQTVHSVFGRVIGKLFQLRKYSFDSLFNQGSFWLWRSFPENLNQKLLKRQCFNSCLFFIGPPCILDRSQVGHFLTIILRRWSRFKSYPFISNTSHFWKPNLGLLTKSPLHNAHDYTHSKIVNTFF